MKKTYGKRALTAEEAAECTALKALYNARKKELKLTQDELGERLGGIGQSGVSHYLNGVNALNATIAAGFARELGIPVAEFSKRLASEIASLAAASEHSNVSPMLQPHREVKDYPVISWIAAGERAESPVFHDSDERLPSTENAGPNGYWLRVKGHSMTSSSYPSFPEGTPILIRPDGFDLISGKFYIARHTSGEYTFKQYIHDAGTGYLVPLNKDYKTHVLDGTWEIIGRAIDAKITGM